MVILDLKMVHLLRRDELKYVTTTYGAVYVETALISLIPMLLAKPLVYQVFSLLYVIGTYRLSHIIP